MGDQLDGIDLGIFDVGAEGDLELPVRDFHRHRLDIRAIRAAGFDPNVEILELTALDVEGKHTPPRSSDALKGLREMELGQKLPVGNIAGERVHRVMLGLVELRRLGIGDVEVRPLNDIAAVKSLVDLPDVAAGIGVPCLRAGVHPNRRRPLSANWQSGS